MVSTHSHPKVAALLSVRRLPETVCFNTQPPEGGCISCQLTFKFQTCFNTQPPEGGCGGAVSTQPAGSSFNTQPPEGGCKAVFRFRYGIDCFNTQPPEGGCEGLDGETVQALVSTHSHPKVAAIYQP